MLIAVTGANGFIATHIVEQLLQNPAYRVLGTVRSLAKGSHLTSLPNATPDRLKLVEADLNNAKSFNFDGVDVVLHTASPFIVNVKDPQTDLVDPARNGTLAVLEAAKAARTVKTVVLTSSIAAITDEPRPGHIFSEADWNTKSSLSRNPYFYSKLVAEKTAWEFMDNNPGCFRLVAINPTFVIGPSHTKAISESVDLCVKNVSIGAFPRMNIAWPFVDVRDVAKAHILGFENKTAVGRHICTAETWPMSKTCDFIKMAHPILKVPGFSAPDPIIWMISYTMPSGNASYLRANIGGSKGYAIDASRIQNKLGMTFRKVEDSIEDTIQSLHKWGHLERI